jgi:hypothetical protein
VPISVSSAPQLPRPRAAVAGLAGSLAVRAVLVAVTSALVAGAVATLTSSPSRPGAPSRAARVPEIRTVPGAEWASFAILRRARTATDSFKAIRSGVGPSGANPALARFAALPSTRLAPLVVSVVPASGSVCLRILLAKDLASWQCQSTARALRGALRVVLGPVGSSPKGPPLAAAPASEDFVVGLVPDGVPSVKITAAHGPPRTVLVHSNVYAARVRAPQAIAFTLPGHRSVSYPARG